MKDSLLTNCFYHPTTAVFLDDNETFLKKLTLGIAEDLPYVTFTDPEKALAHIKENTNTKKLLNDALSENTDSSEYGAHPHNIETKFDLSVLYKQIYNPNRFNASTVLVVDYAMPDMTGIAFCEKLRAQGIKVKTILLTGEADEKLAVEAFNAGTINRFVTKSSAHFEQKVSDACFALEKETFNELSSPILSSLLVQSDCGLNNPAYTKKFQEICKTHNIVEYYVLDNSGSFLLLDANKKPYWLIVALPSDLDDYAFVANDHDAPSQIVEQLKRHEVLAYFLDGQNFMETEGEAWHRHVFPATPIDSAKLFYYSLIEDVPYFGLDKSKIRSFNDFSK